MVCASVSVCQPNRSRCRLRCGQAVAKGTMGPVSATNRGTICWGRTYCGMPAYVRRSVYSTLLAMWQHAAMRPARHRYSGNLFYDFTTVHQFDVRRENCAHRRQDRTSANSRKPQTEPTTTPIMTAITRPSPPQNITAATRHQCNSEPA